MAVWLSDHASVPLHALHLQRALKFSHQVSANSTIAASACSERLIF